MLMCFGGAILGNFVLGEPVFASFDDHQAVLTATVVWWAFCLSLTNDLLGT